MTMLARGGLPSCGATLISSRQSMANGCWMTLWGVRVPPPRLGLGPLLALIPPPQGKALVQTLPESCLGPFGAAAFCAK
eukprot:UN3577